MLGPMKPVEIIARLRETGGRLFASRGILVAYVFGSRISGRPRPDSDLDVGYYVDDHGSGTGLPLRDEMLLAADLSDAVGMDVDLRSLAAAPLELRGIVLEEGARIYSGDDSKRVDLERDLLARYHDYKDVYRQMHEIRLEQIAARGL
jgi:predicted nucleotidyltransferase